MSKVNLLIANSNNNLAGQEKIIRSAIKTATEYSFNKLAIDWDIDVVVSNRGPVSAIPEDKIGGHTFEHDLIILNIEENAPKSNIVETLCHEFCHAARWGKNDEWMNCLFDSLIFEGIATYFEAKSVAKQNKKQFFIKTILNRSDEENEIILKCLRKKLNSKDFDYNTVFFNGDGTLPRWSGYSLGYYLVKNYLEKTGKSIDEVFADNYAEFRIVL